MDGCLEVVPDLIGTLPGLSEAGRSALRHVCDSYLSTIVKDERRRVFKMGRLFTAIRAAILEDGCGEITISAFLRGAEISPNRWATYIRLHELLSPYQDVLDNIQVRIQRWFADRELTPAREEQLATVIRIAKERLVTYAEFESEVLWKKGGLVSSVERLSGPVPEDEDAEDQQVDEEDEVEDALASDQPAPSTRRVEPQETTQASLERTRLRYINGGVRCVRMFLGQINQFCQDHKIQKGPWYTNIEDTAECFVRAIESWTRVPRS
jgi:hypothetical protein